MQTLPIVFFYRTKSKCLSLALNTLPKCIPLPVPEASAKPAHGSLDR